MMNNIQKILRSNVDNYVTIIVKKMYVVNIVGTDFWQFREV